MSEEVTRLQVPVLVQPREDRRGYIARLGSPFDLVAESDTAESALQELARAVQLRLETGSRVLPFALPLAATGPGAAGWLPDDELTQEWRQAVEEYRRECDEADRRRILGE